MEQITDDRFTLIATEKGIEPILHARARRRCETYITQFYPVWLQLNIMRAGTAEEQRKMGAFIDACRAWSNSEQPDPAELEKIRS
ncbi:hypothetical protein [Chromobacterium haemolyticum]|uniref:hypothetical protein n=1 Tax=Chromobacterium haemolyticum TaxID=394935 RepID=UPI00307DC49B